MQDDDEGEGGDEGGWWIKWWKWWMIDIKLLDGFYEWTKGHLWL